MRLTYCSFATDEEGCRGVLILEGHLDPIEASLTASAMRMNPGGEMVAIKVPEDLEEIEVYAANRNRLMTGAEARELFQAKSIREWEQN